MKMVDISASMLNAPHVHCRPVRKGRMVTLDVIEKGGMTTLVCLEMNGDGLCKLRMGRDGTGCVVRTPMVSGRMKNE